MKVFLQKIIRLHEAAELARISETGKRVIDYYIERMSIEDVIIRMNELIREKEAQLQTMLRLFIRKNVFEKRF